MSVTVGTPKYWHLPQARGGLQIGTVDITFDSSYPTGGEPFLYSAIPGLDNSLLGLMAVAQNIKTWVAFYDSTANTIVVNTAGAEVANTTDLTSLTIKFFFMGY